MRVLSKVKRLAKSQKGFTIAEVFIASLLMVMASMGLLSLINSSVQLSGISKEQKDAQQFARTVSERVKALPFYKPYDDSDADIDDYFWGTAEQHHGDITRNEWEGTYANPYINCTLITDPRFGCQVKMAYVEDELDTANMKSDWIPKAGSSQQTKDKPMDANNKPLNVIKYEVKVTWKVQTEHAGSTSYSYTTLVTSTQVQANLGVTAMINTDPNQPKWGTIWAGEEPVGGVQKSNCLSAPHTANALQVKITGYGFKPTGNEAFLMKPGLGDLPVNNLTYVDSGTLTGTVNLDSGSSTAPPWKPRRDPGRWTVRVKEGVAYAYAYDAFTVEFPRPVITGVSTVPATSPPSGKDTESSKVITATGTNVLNLGAGTAPYTATCGATIRLVKDDNPDMVIYSRDDTAIIYAPLALGGYGATYSVTATFDLRDQIAGNYFVEIINCKDNRVEISDGNTISANNATYKFSISVGVPTPQKVYVQKEYPDAPSSHYVAPYVVASGTPPEKRSFAYRNREYKYVLKVEGTDLGSVDTVRMGINGVAANGTSTDFVATGTDVWTSPDSTYLFCTMDFKTVPEPLAVNDSTSYNLWVYLENSTSGSKGSLTNAFMVRKVRPILYKDAEKVNVPGEPAGLYHNYAPVSVKLTGECLENSAYHIYYNSGTYSTMANQRYEVDDPDPTHDDGTMVKGSPTSNGTEWTTQLNLIHCFTGANNIWVVSNDATPVTDNGFTSNQPLTYSSNIVVGSVGATLNPQASGAVTITNRFQDWWMTGPWYNRYWTFAWRGPTSNTEGGSVANAQRSNTQGGDWWWQTIEEGGYAAFTLRGQGFKDQSVGTTNVVLSYWNGSGWTAITGANGNYSVPDPTLLTVYNDRISKSFTISTAEWLMPNIDALGRITLGSNNHNDRFHITQLAW